VKVETTASFSTQARGLRILRLGRAWCFKRAAVLLSFRLGLRCVRGSFSSSSFSSVAMHSGSCNFDEHRVQ
jgi:hypothetical protein